MALTQDCRSGPLQSRIDASFASRQRQDRRLRPERRERSTVLPLGLSSAGGWPPRLLSCVSCPHRSQRRPSSRQRALDMAADHQAERARCDRTVLALERAISLEGARRMRGDSAAIQQVPRLAIGIDRPSADHPWCHENTAHGCWASSPAHRAPSAAPTALDLHLERHPRVPFDDD
jgi:hypothetical protein